MIEVRYTQPASNDLEDIADYIAGYSLERALSLTFELESHFKNLLSSFPKAGRVYQQENEVRMKAHKGYTAFYRIVDENTVEILRVVNLRKPLAERGINFS